MARYNREFLVPYLRDVCALHLACRKLKNHIYQLDNQINSMQKGKYNPEPTRPTMEEDVTGGRVIALLILGFCAFSGLMCIYFGIADGIGSMVFCGLIIAVLFGWLMFVPIGLMKETKKENEQKEAKYWRDFDIYREIETSNEKAKKNIPAVRDQLNRYKKEYTNLTNLLENAYRANIIPSQYRNIYVAVYLYDWFGTSMADDLDHALSMFVLEEIKAKLDRIIENQKEIIFNQYQIASNQQKFMEQQQRHSEMMHAKLNQIQASNEERNAYLHMIESNTATTAFFATADYIRRI